MSLHKNIKATKEGVIEGWGLVATGPIKKGELLQGPDPADRIVTREEFEHHICDYRHGKPCGGWQCDDGLWHIDGDDGQKTNHSCSPNMGWSLTDDNTFVALRDQRLDLECALSDLGYS